MTFILLNVPLKYYISCQDKFLDNLRPKSAKMAIFDSLWPVEPVQWQLSDFMTVRDFISNLLWNTMHFEQFNVAHLQWICAKCIIPIKFPTTLPTTWIFFDGKVKKRTCSECFFFGTNDRYLN